MTLSEALLPEFDQEIAATRKTLDRVPENPGFTPHPKSTPLGKLAVHVAELLEFSLKVLETQQLDFSVNSYQPVAFESASQVVKLLDDGAAKVRPVLAGMTDEAWKVPWKLRYEGQTVFEGPRFMAYREMIMNHLIHHRAQLGVYLRLNGVPVPGTYGPSADEA